MLLKIITETRTDTLAPPVSTGRFSKCTARFDGCPTTVSAFVTTINALDELPLLLTVTASVWWQSVKNEVTIWQGAIKLIVSAFSPSQPAHQLYIELFSDRQEKRTPIDEFVCRKRALLGQLLNNRHDEETQRDMIFGLLHIDLRKEISRQNSTTFSDLQKGREIELLHRESVITEKTQVKPGRPENIKASTTSSSTGKCKDATIATIADILCMNVERR